MGPTFCLALVTRKTDDAILLVKHPQRGWELPGGHCETNESPEQTQQAEVSKEEATEDAKVEEKKEEAPAQEAENKTDVQS